jgi:low temperature requirement protein LtrA
MLSPVDLPADEVRGGTGRSATFVELFFDLVYVFAITQVVGLVHEDPTVGGLAKGALVLMIMWCTWSIYTWTINWTGTASVPIRLFLLAAMGASMLMATAVPDALSDESALFGATLFVARMLGAVNAGRGVWAVDASHFRREKRALRHHRPG